MKAHTPQSDYLISTLRGDPELEVLVEMFVDEMPDRIAAIRHSAETGDVDCLRRLIHQIKGSAGSHGFQPISDCAARLEDSIRNGRPEDEIRREVFALMEICARARP